MTEGQRTQVTLAVAAMFTILNSFYPDLLTAEVQASITTLLLLAAGIFFAMQVQRIAGK